MPRVSPITTPKSMIPRQRQEISVHVRFSPCCERRLHVFVAKHIPERNEMQSRRALLLSRSNLHGMWPRARPEVATALGYRGHGSVRNALIRAASGNAKPPSYR